jgi:hypothetical protein
LVVGKLAWQKSFKNVSIFFANGKVFEIKLEIELENKLEIDL